MPTFSRISILISRSINRLSWVSYGGLNLQFFFQRSTHFYTPQTYTKEWIVVWTYDVFIASSTTVAFVLWRFESHGKWFDCRVCRFEVKSRRKWPMLTILVRTVVNILSDFNSDLVVSDSTVVCVLWRLWLCHFLGSDFKLKIST